MLELAADLGFFDESTDESRVARVSGVKRLEGHVAPDVGVPSLKHHSHTASGDFAEDLVAAPNIPRGVHFLGRTQDGMRRIRLVAQ
jgi:hypothetical protein